jgi:uncharacterized protein (DUF1015 family)
MAEIRPFRALRYDTRAVGSLEAVIAPPYDVIDDALRAELAARSPFNVVEIDLPHSDGDDPYLHAQTTLETWRQQGLLVRDREPAIWVLEQEFAGPDGAQRTRRGFFCTVRVEEYGPGRIRPHERTHPGPKEDRLRLTRATRANLSPIFSLFADPGGAAIAALAGATGGEPVVTATDHAGTLNRLWRVTDDGALATTQAALESAELLIADGHHRYETARVYAEEIGGEGEHRYVLMYLCPLSDPGLAVFPTHRLLTGLKDDQAKQLAIREALLRDFEVGEVKSDELEPPAGAKGVQLGYMDSFHKQPYRVALKDQAIADAALPGRSEGYRRLDAAVLEALVLKGALGMSDDDIAHLRGLGYSNSTSEARESIESGRFDAGFFLRATPVEQVREVAAAGESMPPKSTYFYPKVPTGLVFNLLE